MEAREGILKNLESMRDKDELFFNMFQDGGAQVYCVNYDWYVLFEIPLYGGEPMYSGIFYKNELEKLVDLALSWT